jgi:hypothetical protein
MLAALPVDVLSRIGSLAQKEDVPALRATCRALREHVSRPEGVKRSAMLRSAALAAWAWGLDGFRSAGFLEPEQRTLCMLAARVGSVGALAWLRENDCAWDERTCEAAAEGGHLAALQWAREHGCDWDHRTCEAAAGGGHLAVLQSAREHGCEWDGARVLLQMRVDEERLNEG